MSILFSAFSENIFGSNNQRQSKLIDEMTRLISSDRIKWPHSPWRSSRLSIVDCRLYLALQRQIGGVTPNVSVSGHTDYSPLEGDALHVIECASLDGEQAVLVSIFRVGFYHSDRITSCKPIF